MELIVTIPQYNAVHGNITGFVEGVVLDRFESLIWTDRFNGYGDFQLTTPFDISLITTVPEGAFVTMDGSDRIMIVESHEIKSDPKNGAKSIIKGRSLESILDRRIVWRQTILNADFDPEIQRLVYENAVWDATYPNRSIPNLITSDSQNDTNTGRDPYISTLTVDAQFTGDNLYTAVYGLCDSESIGFRIKLEPGYNWLRFQLYSAKDRSYGQTVYDPVVFSPNFDNLTSSDYVDSIVGFKTVALVGGEGQGTARRETIVDNGGVGLDRREMFVNAADISSTTSGTALTDAQYLALLTTRGQTSLAAVTSTTTFQGEVEITKRFVYGKDFFLGDIVSIENEYGVSASSRVTEIIFSQDSSKISIIPTFTAI